MQTVASREKASSTVRLASGSSGQTTSVSWTSPPIQRQAAERCAQSASSDFHDEPASAAECPESESPEENARLSKKAGHRSTARSVSQARKSSAETSAKPSVIAMNAAPNRD